jgi:hypothetical protein
MTNYTEFNTVRIELDATEPDALNPPADVAVRITETEGQNGWPMVEVLGQREAVAAYVENAWGEDLSEYLDEVVLVTPDVPRN